MCNVTDSEQQAVAIAFPLTDWWQARRDLLRLQAATELAIRTLDQVRTFDAPTVVDGVHDIFVALNLLLASGPCMG